MKIDSSWLLMVAGIMALVALPATPMQLDKPCPSVPGCQCNPEESIMCLSKTCVNTASEIISSMDETQDPCEDFYQFACGNWAKNNPIPEGISKYSVLTKLQLQNQQIIRTALEKVNLTDENGAESKAKLFYDSCLDKSGIKEKLGAKPLLDIILDVGGWHLLDNTINKDTEELELQVLLQNIRKKYNVRALMTWSVQPDRRNHTENVIVLEADTSLPWNYYVNKTSNRKAAYLNYITRVSVLLGANETQAKEEMSRVIQFETELTELTNALENKTNHSSLNQEFTIKQWQEKANFLNWTLFFNDVLSLVEKTITENEIIIVKDAPYFLKLSKVLTKYTEGEENKKTLRSYLILKMFGLTKFLSKQFRDAIVTLKKELFDYEGPHETWQLCVEETVDVFGFAVGAMFVREVFTVEAKAESELLFKNIRDTFKNHLMKLDWIDDKTREAAEAKANAVRVIFGYPDYILRKKELDIHYEKLVVRPDTYFQNRLYFGIYDLKRNLRKLGRPDNRTEWSFSPSEVIGHYSAENNLISMPAGILQPPLFARGRPASANYGGSGMVMAHELVHMFTSRGSKYDRSVNKNYSWSNATVQRIKERAKCILEQYSNYSIDGLPLNGEKTLDENIADNGGLKASFHAYLDHSRTDARANLTLPGLKYNHRQLFFISFAQVWCSAKTTKFTKKELDSMQHSVKKYRVIGALSNLVEFSEEFQCPVGSKMNPKNKCELW